MKTLWMVAALAAMAPTIALAQQPGGVYITAAVGRAELDIDAVSENLHDLGWSLGAGWQFLPYLGVELSYFNPRTMTIKEGALRYDMSYEDLTASLLGVLPLGRYFSLFARAGAARWETEEEISLAGAPLVKGKLRDTDLLLGAGVGVMWEGARVRLEYSRVDLGDTERSFASLGVQWFIWKP
jgi:OmpA-OmpF porin, OOP family